VPFPPKPVAATAVDSAGTDATKPASSKVDHSSHTATASRTSPSTMEEGQKEVDMATAKTASPVAEEPFEQVLEIKFFFSLQCTVVMYLCILFISYYFMTSRFNKYRKSSKIAPGVSPYNAKKMKNGS
jgi:hypothetical protein